MQTSKVLRVLSYICFAAVAIAISLNFLPFVEMFTPGSGRSYRPHNTSAIQIDALTVVFFDVVCFLIGSALNIISLFFTPRPFSKLRIAEVSFVLLALLFLLYIICTVIFHW